MPSTRSQSVLWRTLALAVVAVLLLAACGNSDDDDSSGAAGGPTTTASSGSDSGSKVDLSNVPGVTDSEIRFSAVGTNSNNPLGTCVLDCYVDGVKAYFDFVNSKGGIGGRKLVLSKVVDDELSKNQQKALEIISANDTFATFSATQFASGWADLAKAGIPMYVWNIHPKESAQDSVFGNQGVTCITCTQRIVAYAAQQAKAKKVATLGYGISENSKLCAKSTAESIEKYSKDIGGTTVAYVNDNLPFGLPNGIGPEVTAMKNAGVDMVYGCLDLNGMKTIAQELQRQGMGDTPMYHPNTYDQTFIKNAGQLFEGDFVFVTFRPFEAASAGSALADFKSWMSKSGSKITEPAMYGWINADTAFQALKLAGPNFDRAKVIEAANTKLTKYTAGGLIAPLDYSRQHTAPTEDDPKTHGNQPDCGALLRVESGALQVVGDTSKPFVCWPGDTRAWSEPANMTFD